jgi:hypothetical protein
VDLLRSVSEGFMADDDFNFTFSNTTVIAACVAVVGVVLALAIPAAWVGRERARQSVECMKTEGAEWVDGACVKAPPAMRASAAPKPCPR